MREQHSDMFFYCFFDFWGKIGGNGALQTVLKREKAQSSETW